MLLKFNLGDLPLDTIDELAAHLAECHHCATALEAFAPAHDELLDLLQATPQAQATPHVNAAGEAPQAAPGSSDAATASAMPGRAAEPLACGCTRAATGAGERFRPLRPHAEGGLGIVHVAFDVELNREVAFKQIQERHADDPLSRRRFLQEAEITGGLEHPGIVPVYALGTRSDGRPYYAMRLVKGESLKHAIANFYAGPVAAGDQGQRSLALRNLLRRLVDVCNAIAYAHSRGVLHRDIKPANIILGKHGETSLVDWGLAKPTGQAAERGDLEETALVPRSIGDSAETLPGSTLGTPAYMSPEQARGALGQIGPHSDVYSIGATLYCLLTGKPPFEGQSAEVLKAAQSGGFQRPRAISRWIDPGLEAVCLKGMALSPEDRYRSANALAEDIERWMAGEPVSAWREPFGLRARRWLRRRERMVVGASAAVAMALVGLLGFSAYQRQANRQLNEVNQNLQAANRRAEHARSRAEDRVALALRSVEEFQRVVTENLDVKNRPELTALRKDLLQAPREFYGLIVRDIQSNPESEPESQFKLAQALLGLSSVTGAIDSEPEAIRLARTAVGVLDGLTRVQPTANAFHCCAPRPSSHSPGSRGPRWIAPPHEPSPTRLGKPTASWCAAIRAMSNIDSGWPRPRSIWER
jgi:tRNA A-37 threonylcarbamoyl transferase component Bud32